MLRKLRNYMTIFIHSNANHVACVYIHMHSLTHSSTQAHTGYIRWLESCSETDYDFSSYRRKCRGISISFFLDYYLDKKYVTFLLISSIRFFATQFLCLHCKFHFPVFKLVQSVQQMTHVSRLWGWTASTVSLLKIIAVHLIADLSDKHRNKILVAWAITSWFINK